jgi:hypothetical protein
VILGVPIAGIFQYIAARAVAPYRQPVDLAPAPALDDADKGPQEKRKTNSQG